MIDNSREYILCAAIKRKVPKQKTCLHHNDIHLIEIGFRHPDIRDRFRGEIDLSPHSQGFYTSKGRFVDRIEAMKIAVDCGQVTGDKLLIGHTYDGEPIYNQLFSEDLY